MKTVDAVKSFLSKVGEVQHNLSSLTAVTACPHLTMKIRETKTNLAQLISNLNDVHLGYTTLREGKVFIPGTLSQVDTKLKAMEHNISTLSFLATMFLEATPEKSEETIALILMAVPECLQTLHTLGSLLLPMLTFEMAMSSATLQHLRYLMVLEQNVKLIPSHLLCTTSNKTHAAFLGDEIVHAQAALDRMLNHASVAFFDFLGSPI